MIGGLFADHQRPRFEVIELPDGSLLRYNTEKQHEWMRTKFNRFD